MNKVLAWMLGWRAYVLDNKIRNGKWRDGELFTSNPSGAVPKRQKHVAGHSSALPVFTCYQSKPSQVLIGFVDFRSNVMKARIRYAWRWFKFESISVHNIKFQDPSSKCYHYIKAYTYVFNGSVQWFPPCGSWRYFPKSTDLSVCQGLCTLNTVSLTEHTMVFSDYGRCGSTAANTQH